MSVKMAVHKLTLPGLVVQQSLPHLPPPPPGDLSRQMGGVCHLLIPPPQPHHHHTVVTNVAGPFWKVSVKTLKKTAVWFNQQFCETPQPQTHVYLYEL